MHPETMPCITDKGPLKQDRVIPGPHIPVASLSLIQEDRPHHILLLV
jgi:hypothetical protein